jgi:hypothetical protein
MSLKITKKDYTSKRGDTLQSGLITLSVADTPAFVWTGVTIRVEVRLNDKSIKVMTPSVDLTTAGLCKFQWEIPASETANYVLNNDYDYDVQYTLPTGFVKTPIEGKIKMVKDYSRV